jgi:hypothetical protein
MNFPMDYPIFKFFYWLLNTPGVGGIFVGTLASVILLTFGRTLLWISGGAKAEESETYTYPTSAMLEHEE